MGQLYRGDHAINECIARLELYQQAGADGAFIPGLHDLRVIKKLHHQLSQPVNLMGWPTDTTSDDLANAGVRRVSSGPALFLECYSQYQQACVGFLNTTLIDDVSLDYAVVNQLFS